MKNSLTYLVFFLVIQAVAGVLAMVVKQAGVITDVGMNLIITSVVASVVTVTLFILTRWCPADCLEIRKSQLLPVLVAVLLAVSSLLPLAWLEELIPEKLTQDVNAEVFEMLLGRMEGYVVIGLMAPLCEEIVFRGAMLKALLKKYGGKHWIAIAVSAALFAIGHLNPAQMPHAFIVGLLLGWMCYRTGSIVPGIVLHWVNNTSVFLLCACFPELPYDAKIADYFGENITFLPFFLIGSLVVSIVAIWLFTLCSGSKPNV